MFKIKIKSPSNMIINADNSLYSPVGFGVTIILLCEIILQFNLGFASGRKTENKTMINIYSVDRGMKKLLRNFYAVIH